MTPELWEALYQRDQGRCMARVLDPDADPCRGRWGEPVKIDRSTGWIRRRDLTADHVHSGYGMMGKRAKNRLENLVLLCWHHHIYSGWRSRNVWRLRRHLASLYPHA